MRLLLLAFLSVLVVACATPWRDRLKAELPALGHRNWIVIADSAYPWQANAGIETIATDATQLEVVRAVLAAVDASVHVRPAVYLDAELAHVSEADAPGIEAYRRALTALLGARPVQRELAHEQVIARLDQDAALYRVLILKTNLALPYTSVFVRLECGYWSAEAEQRLRAALGAK